MEQAEAIVERARQNPAFVDSYTKLLIAAMIAAKALNRDINKDMAGIIAQQPELAPSAPAAAAHDMDILRV